MGAGQPTPYNFDASQALPKNIKFGTSTWTYPGWKGLIYFNDYRSEKQFKSESLGEYCKCPLFKTVGIDSSFYSPLTEKLLLHYAGLVPEDFRWVSKVWERITIPAYPRHARYGKLAGQNNPQFLDAKLFIERVLAPFVHPEIGKHAGPFVFQFPTIANDLLTKLSFLERLNNFLGELPKDFRYAVELRNPGLLTEKYFRLLNDHGATHCFNHWNFMPSLKDQMLLAANAGGLVADFYVARLLTPRGVDYAGAVKLFTPYDKIKKPNPEARDHAAILVKRAIERKADAYIIVNNRLEGHSPGTIDAIIAKTVTRSDFPTT